MELRRGLAVDTSGGTGTFTYSDNLVDAATPGDYVNASIGLTKYGTYNLLLTGTNTYTGTTTVVVGQLTAAGTASLAGYNVAGKIAVGGSGTLALQVAGAGFASDDIRDFLAANAGGFAVGSALGLDTTNSSTTSFAYNNAMSGNFGLTKLVRRHADPRRQQQLCGHDHDQRRHVAVRHCQRIARHHRGDGNRLWIWPAIPGPSVRWQAAATSPSAPARSL